MRFNERISNSRSKLAEFLPGVRCKWKFYHEAYRSVKITRFMSFMEANMAFSIKRNVYKS